MSKLPGSAVVIIIAMAGSGPSQGQTGELTTISPTAVHEAAWNDRIEKSAETTDLENDGQSVAEHLDFVALKPVNLNVATQEELGRIPYLSRVQREKLYHYLVTFGAVLSVYELQSIEGFDSLLIQNISPYIRISPPSGVPRLTPGNLARSGRHDLLLRYKQTFPLSAGYRTADTAAGLTQGPAYPGTPQKYYFRYSYNWFDKIRLGIAGEKDPGEQFFRGGQSGGMDFYAGYLSFKSAGILRNLIIGNFTVSYGQGLTMGSGLVLVSSPGFSVSANKTGGVRPGLGMNEGSYLRGVAAAIKIKTFEISAFGSYHSRDASISRFDSLTAAVLEVTSLNETGLHRTSPEQATRNSLKELVAGGNISMSVAPNQQFGFKAGVTGLFYRYSARLEPKLQPYSLFYFRGTQNFNTGFDLRVRYRGMYFFTEVTRGANTRMAWLAGALISPDPRVGITLIYRHYHPAFQNPFSNAFGQNSPNSNENGIFFSMNAVVHRKVNVTGYLDRFSFPWLKYRVDTPSGGLEAGLLAVWQPSGNVSVSLRLYQKNTGVNEPAGHDQVVHKLTHYRSRSYRLSLEWTPANALILNTRIELKEAGVRSENLPFGQLVYQEMQLRFNKNPEIITVRFSLFDITDYACRIYSYEPDVLYGYSVPAYQGKGSKTCLVMKFSISRQVDLWLRGSLTYYTDRQESGSGNDLTKGNHREELSGQIVVRF